MIWNIYLIILIYFILGGIGFYFINRNKDPLVAKDSYIKFITYFFIVNGLFFSITMAPFIFKYLAIVVILMGIGELTWLFKKSNYDQKAFFSVSMIIFAFLSINFYLFSNLPTNLILFSFLILSIFDAFSQVTGQLWGKTIILPKISPNKTLEGLMGGACIAIAGAFLLNKLYGGTRIGLVFLTVGIVIFAFLGDLAASYYKRKYKVKNFNNLIPGHGGFLDRFDSLIAGGAWVAWFNLYVDI